DHDDVDHPLAIGRRRRRVGDRVRDLVRVAERSGERGVGGDTQGDDEEGSAHVAILRRAGLVAWRVARRRTSIRPPNARRSALDHLGRFLDDRTTVSALTRSDRAFLDRNFARYGAAWHDGIVGLERNFEVAIAVRKTRYVVS